ncbi:DUF2827 domain-containing protein [Paludibacterium yongneupense]|uniref:DUF2827 domain-containing protein n=1 Tax=Paludibacterium yongneupense TaxID=400061 RepID=UPI0004116A69|nr:DUF2827 domain-containing protein [Paludibacterium yongneupense]
MNPEPMRRVDGSRKLKVGVTFFLMRDPEQTIWSNGTLQNIVFLVLMLRASPDIGEVWLVNGGDGDCDAVPPALLLDGLDLRMANMADIAPRLDVLIEGGAQVPVEVAASIRRRGGAIVAYRCGNDYVLDAERICFDLAPGPLVTGLAFDEVWTQPQHERSCRGYWETVLRAPVRVLPHIWDPYFFDCARVRFEAMLPGVPVAYAPRSGPRRIAVFEPNLNVIKNCLYPLLVCEQAYRQAPALIAGVYATNTAELGDNPTLQYLARALDLFRDGKLGFEARYDLPASLAQFTDVVVSHQWENGLNYLYYDVLHAGFPLVHNSPFIRDAGYYYPDFDAAAGGRALLQALRHHDEGLDDYRERSRRVLDAASIANPANVESHVAALYRVCHARASASG